METFRYSRIRAYQLCPQRHHYEYVEGIKTKPNPAMLMGQLFHECLEHYYKDDGKIGETLEKYQKAVLADEIPEELDQLEYTLTNYCQMYSDDIKNEEIVMCEEQLEDALGKGERFTIKADRVVYNKNTRQYILRDTKTSKKGPTRTHDDVYHNSQLLTYIPFIEDKLGVKIDAMEIDEVRFAKLIPPPLNNNGKPTGDRKRLTLTTYEDYYDLLCSMELEEAPEYQNVLDFMRCKPHPLFRRTRAHVSSREVISNNMQDIFNTYKLIKCEHVFRNRGPLCRTCSYKALCNLDMHGVSEASRAAAIVNLYRQITPDEEVESQISSE